MRSCNAPYAKLYARPGAIARALRDFAAFDQDAIAQVVPAADGKLDVPVLLALGARSFSERHGRCPCVLPQTT